MSKFFPEYLASHHSYLSEAATNILVREDPEDDDDEADDKGNGQEDDGEDEEDETEDGDEGYSE